MYWIPTLIATAIIAHTIDIHIHSPAREDMFYVDQTEKKAIEMAKKAAEDAKKEAEKKEKEAKKSK